LLGGVKLGWEYLAKGIFEDNNSGQKAAPGSVQATGLDHPGRGIQSTTDLRLGIEESLQRAHFQRAIRQPGAGQHRDGVAAAGAHEALNSETLASSGFAKAPIKTVTMKPS
jgi:hypothetical protein